MTSARGLVIGLLIIVLGLTAIGTFLSPDWLFSIGIDIRTYNAINEQFKFWLLPIGIGVIIAGLIAMGKFE
jgi:hypothetical protein